MRLFGGTSNPTLTQEVCDYLGIEPGKITAKTFSDGETQIEIHENVILLCHESSMVLHLTLIFLDCIIQPA